MFLAPKVAPMQMSKFGETYLLVVSCPEQEFISADKGGALYTLPSNAFQRGPSDMPEVKWFSADPVPPNAKEEFVSSLAAMRHYGVGVYFVDAATYATMQHAKDHGWELLSNRRESGS